jgi:hypothetical protein
MAGGTIHSHLVHAQPSASGDTDGEISHGFIDEPERGVAPWQLVGTDGGQDLEDPIRRENSADGA